MFLCKTCSPFWHADIYDSVTGTRNSQGLERKLMVRWILCRPQRGHARLPLENMLGAPLQRHTGNRLLLPTALEGEIVLVPTVSTQQCGSGSGIPRWQVQWLTYSAPAMEMMDFGTTRYLSVTSRFSAVRINQICVAGECGMPSSATRCCSRPLFGCVRDSP